MLPTKEFGITVLPWKFYRDMSTRKWVPPDIAQTSQAANGLHGTSLWLIVLAGCLIDLINLALHVLLSNFLTLLN